MSVRYPTSSRGSRRTRNLAVLKGLVRVADVAPAGHQVVAEFDALTTQLLPLGQHPVVQHPRQQIAVVHRDCRCTMLEHRVLVAGGHRLQCQLPLAVKNAYVDPARR